MDIYIDVYATEKCSASPKIWYDANMNPIWHEKFLPHICIICDSPTERDFDLCPSCEKLLPQIIIGFEQDTQLLGNNLLSWFYYQPPITQMITALKFANQLIYAEILGKLLAMRLTKYYEEHPRPEVIIPVPLHPKRLRERGYNQALEIAKPIAKQLNIPIVYQVARRCKKTKPQALLSAKARANNVKNAFVVDFQLAKQRAYIPIGFQDAGKAQTQRAAEHSKSYVSNRASLQRGQNLKGDGYIPIDWIATSCCSKTRNDVSKQQRSDHLIMEFGIRHVAVIDDVVTTGNTLREFCKELTAAQVQKIDIWCCARSSGT